MERAYHDGDPLMVRVSDDSSKGRVSKVENSS